MTPTFWKYLITIGDGSAIRFVAEQDREWTEKELVIRAFSAIEQDHKFNPLCSVVLLNEFYSSFVGHEHNFKKRR